MTIQYSHIMTYLENYFSNLMSRTWLGEASQSVKLEKSHIQAIYTQCRIKNYDVIMGETEKFFFILECHDSDGYQYSNGLFHSNFASLIKGYQLRESFLNGMEIETFIKVIQLQKKLENELGDSSKNIKRFKI